MFVYINLPRAYNQEAAYAEYIRVMKLVKTKHAAAHFLPPVYLEGKDAMWDLGMVLRTASSASAVAFQKDYALDPFSVMFCSVCNLLGKAVIMEEDL